MPDGVVIDRANNVVHISRTYAAGVDRAWWAWTDPEAISRWRGPRGWAATVYEMDVRPGGRWRFQIVPVDGSAAAVRSGTGCTVDVAASFHIPAQLTYLSTRPSS